jgi:hypothetical protein
MLAGEAPHILTPGVVDQLRCPVTRGERRVKPLQGGHARAPGTTDGEAHTVNSCRGVADEPDGGVLTVGGLGERARVAQHLADRPGIERDDARMSVDLLRDRPHVVGRDRAHAAQRLCDDQVGGEIAQQLVVELVDRLALERSLADGGVDLARAETGGEDVAGDLRQLARGGRVVALVCHGHQLGAEPEGKQHLRGRRHQAYDSHGLVFSVPRARTGMAATFPPSLHDRRGPIPK